MKLHASHSTHLADASLVTAAKSLGIRRVFTLDRNDFGTYRVRQGHRHQSIQIVPDIMDPPGPVKDAARLFMSPPVLTHSAARLHMLSLKRPTLFHVEHRVRRSEQLSAPPYA